jgi:hypothetical protein
VQDYTEDPSLGRRPDPVVGTPEQDAAAFDGQQSYDDTCAIRCQEFILEQFQPGAEYDETALVREAQSMGWYAPGQGTSPEDLGNILELHGIGVNRYEDATAYDLANELAQGHKVMISVDSGELWDNSIKEKIADLGVDDGPDHAVVVSGIDTTDPDNPKVIISDPGTGEPAAKYPMDQFVGAWEDGGFQMVSTQDPAPRSVPGMQNFDYAAGHIPEVAGMPYKDFVETYEHDPTAFNEVISTPEDGDVVVEYAEPDPIDTPEETEQLLDEADALIEHSDALIEDLQDGPLDTHGQP